MRRLHHSAECRAAAVFFFRQLRVTPSDEFFSKTAISGDIMASVDEHVHSRSTEDEMLPLSEKLALKADAFDAERRRLRFMLWKKPQFLRTAASWSLFPAVAQPADDAPPPVGTASIILGPIVTIVRRLALGTTEDVKMGFSTALAETNANANLRFLIERAAMHRLNYYSTINLVPKKNMWLAVHVVLWNAYVGLQNAILSVAFGAVRGYARPSSDRIGSIAKQTALGALAGAEYCVVGLIVSPVIHIPNGILNSFCGLVNFFSGKLFFDANSGRYYRCDLRHADTFLKEMISEVQAIKLIGMREFQRKKMEPDSKFKEQVQNMGFKLGRSRMGRKLRGETIGEENESNKDPYEILQLKRSSTPAQIKLQYKKLAKVFHPDVVQAQRGGTLSGKDKEEAQRKFESIAEAYQILSNPERKKAYDNGGRQGLKVHESQFGKFASSSIGELVQNIFGGRAFRETLLGDLYKSHWDLRYQHQVSVSIHDFECLQCIRVSVLALKLRAVLDVHASSTAATPAAKTTTASADRTPAQKKMSASAQQSHAGSDDPLLKARKSSPSSSSAPARTVDLEKFGSVSEFNDFSQEFKMRCSAFAKQLSEACHGPQLLHDAGESFSISGQRFLGKSSFLGPKFFVYRKLGAGLGRLKEGFSAHVKDKTKEELAKMVLAEYFNMEYDNVMTDAAIILRYAAQQVLQDQSVDSVVRKKRCYALWYLGEEFMRQGVPFGEGKRDDEELTAYLQQAATSAKTTGPPPRF